MDFASLQVFKAVADEGGISPAARKLHRVQSNVTTRIQGLEASLGTQLFVREKRRLHLSPAGLIPPSSATALKTCREAKSMFLDSRTIRS